MAENYKHLYEQMKKMVIIYQDELVPGFREKITELEADNAWLRENLSEAVQQLDIERRKVKHGHWIYKQYEDDGALWLYHCSGCGTPNARERNYCQYCGAMMDGDTIQVEQETVAKKDRTINKNNPKNIYCGHCEHFNKGAGDDLCKNEHSKHFNLKRYYYNRCKCFEWRKDAKYAG